MLSVAIVTWTAVGLGFLASAAIGYALRKETGCILVFGFTFPAFVLGLALSFGAGIFHSYCANSWKICPPTTAENVWGIIFPLILSPAYWITTLVVHTLCRLNKQHD